MVGSGKQAPSRPEGPRSGVCVLGEGDLAPTQPARSRAAPVGFGAQPQPKLNVWSWRGDNQSPPNQLEDSPVPSGVWGAD